MDWYTFISENGDTMVDSGSTNESDEDDVKLLGRKILEKVILPRATQLIYSFNPYSSKQTKYIIEFCNKSLNYVDKNSPKFEVSQNIYFNWKFHTLIFVLILKNFFVK